jgi:LuxR family maltose regulon positive regulatory protein
LGAHASAALGVVLAAEGDLAAAERELGYAERFFRDDVRSIHHTWLLLTRARVRCRRGRLEAAATDLAGAHVALTEHPDCGVLQDVYADAARELSEARHGAEAGRIVAAPSQAESNVLQMLTSDLSVPQIAGELFLSVNTVRSHTRSIYRKLGVNSRRAAVARAEVLGLVPVQSRSGTGGEPVERPDRGERASAP